ncbi:hypothetical protein Clacol_007973 [Clathrus columnatus]|uniref:Phospholipid-transporting ATPase n=1 Tax=Clathrus columnatus TaxID=1419009 RepID=A0AAV5AIY4_9AGAM|nr:hypothetical protein Clacol_007973 [Clathrus columnatus]
MSKSWTNRLTNWNVESLFSRKPSPKTKRSIFVNEPLPNDYFDHKHRIKREYVYSTNQIVTSKYTVITFLPRNLLEQFRRVANIFFLVIDILQFFSQFSTVSPGLVVTPLILVLGITAAKDGYEDIKRHQGDRRVNHSTALILSGGGWENPNQTGEKAKTFVRGVLKTKQGPAGPYTPVDDTDAEVDEDENGNESEHPRTIKYAEGPSRPHWKRTLWEDVRVGDFIKVRCDEPLPADIVICATSQDDNEAFVETKNLDGETNLKSRRAVDGLQYLRSAKACAQSPAFRIDCDAPDVNMFKLNGAIVTKDGDTSPITIQTTLLRGTVLRNTQWVIGIILYTGQDTKITLNSGDTPSKRSRVEIQMNRQVAVNLIILLVLVVICGIVDSVIEQKRFPEGAPWLFDDDQSGDNPRINGLITWANGFVTFQDIIPISLYLSVEFVRTCQAAFIYTDHQIYYEKTNQATLARSWNLSDDLGQIEYIFSDKTGTLTQNLMIFRKCTVDGTSYHESTGDTVEIITKKGHGKGSESISIAPTIAVAAASSASLSTASPQFSPGQFRSAELTMDLQNLAKANQMNDPFFNRLTSFFALLSLCHTVLAAEDSHTKEIRYKAQSPDEAALVQAAADVGFIFLGREREMMRIQTPYSGEPLEFELLNVLEFSSARRRMSVILRRVDDPDRKVYVLSKGADNVIYSRLREDESEEMKATTQQHLDQFANDGLRTLCLGYKVLSESEYDEWERSYDEATVALDNREEKIEQVSSQLEMGFTLLGGTAIEDKLQDGVPETIADLKRAGIKLWVLTGDKLETAIAIGYSTNLIAPDSTLIIIRGGGDSAIPVEQQLLDSVDKFFPDSDIIESVQAMGVELPHSLRHQISPEYSKKKNVELVDIPKSNHVLVINGLALGDALDNPFLKEVLLKIGIRCQAVICCGVSPLQKALTVNLVKDGLQTMTLAIGDGANDVSMIQTAHIGVGIRGEEGLQAVNSADYAIAQMGRSFDDVLVPIFETAIIGSWTLVLRTERHHMGISLWPFPSYIAMGDNKGGTDPVYLLSTCWREFSSTSAREDGFDGYIYEFSTAIAIATVTTANLFNGINTWAWSGWVWFAVSFGIIFVWTYTLIYSAISPNAFVTTVFGNDYFLFRSPIFWFSVLISIFLALLPHYLYKYIQQVWRPTDIDILKEIQRRNPNADFASYTSNNTMRSFDDESTLNRSTINAVPLQDLGETRSLSYTFNRSMTDMSLGGEQTTNRGFNFAAEEGGVHLRRIQSNLSERRKSMGKSKKPLFSTLKRTFRSIRRTPSTSAQDL